MTFTHFVGKVLILSMVTIYGGHWLHRSLITFGPYNTVYNHAPGPCRLVEGVEHGSEDIQLLPNGIAIITSGLQKLKGEYNEYFNTRKGQILTFDLNNPQKQPVALKLQGFDSSTFNPHGLSIWNDKKNGKIYVYVISHPNTAYDIVEKFLYLEKEATLVHQQSITDTKFQNLNDLVVIEEDVFYASNYHYFHHPLGGTIETVLKLKWGSVVYYDGKDSKLVERNLLMPNGINVSPDQKLLYLAHIHGQEVLTYRILPNRDLEKVSAFVLDTNLDNLDVDPKTGDIWTAGHPVGYKTLKFLDRPDPAMFTTPSHALRLKVKDGIPVSMTEVYSDDGNTLHASSVAVIYNNALLIGTVHNKLMYCEIKYIQD